MASNAYLFRVKEEKRKEKPYEKEFVCLKIFA